VFTEEQYMPSPEENIGRVAAYHFARAADDLNCTEHDAGNGVYESSRLWTVFYRLQ